MIPLYLSLIHAPVLTKDGSEGISSVTNLDLHDISRSCRSFGFKNFFVVTPLQAQHELVLRILDYWKTPGAKEYNPDRYEALSLIRLTTAWEDCAKEIEEKEGRPPLKVVTGASLRGHGSMHDLCTRATLDKTPILLIFGTGHGLSPSVTEKADFRLNPITGLATDGYNHLSVRSAVAIYLDQLAQSLKGII